jgi:hypothetical protein
MIALKNPIRLITPPKHTINIAVHIRDGGRADHPSMKRIAPVKFPPLTFYTEALSKIAPLFPNQRIYCQIFTDAINPKPLITALKQALPPNAIVRFTPPFNKHSSTNVLRDFFSFFNFDILIRPDSNFSLVPSRLHDFAIVYSPKSAITNQDIVTIDQIFMEIDDALYQQLRLKYKPWWKIF